MSLVKASINSFFKFQKAAKSNIQNTKWINISTKSWFLKNSNFTLFHENNFDSIITQKGMSPSRQNVKRL
jgi:hypothetical protein